MNISNIKPLVTFGLIAYKQEKFIKEAVMSALSQDYSPLEIVICDDCSPDNTFLIIENLVSNYTGPHKVIVHRNERNLGLAGNINRMWELSKGGFLVIQAGDDISVPHRTSRMVDAWLSTEPHPSIVYSNEMFIDESGAEIKENQTCRVVNYREVIEETLTGKKPFVIGGCAAGYSRKTHFDVGPLLLDIRAEDFIYSFRALLSDGCIGINEPLIMYRQNTDSIMGNFRRGSIADDRKLKGDLSRLVEYKKAICTYGNVGRYYRWVLNRQVELAKRRLEISNGSLGQKIRFYLWALVTCRANFLFKAIIYRLGNGS